MNSSTSSFRRNSSKAEYKKLLRLLVFVGLLGGFLFLLEVVTQYGVKKSRTGEIGKINGIMNRSLDADVAVFGSSVALVHFDPAIISANTGFTVYNFGINGTSLAQYHGLLSEYLAYAKADYIVLAGSYSEMLARHQLYEVYKFRHHISNPNIYNSFYSIDPALTSRLRYVPFYSFSIYNKAYFQAALRGFRGASQAMDAQNGFSPEYLAWGDRAGLKPGDVAEEIEADEIKRYARTIQEINARGKKAILVLTPIYVEGQQQIDYLPKVRAIYQELAGQENYFFDFTQSPICRQQELFYNNTHLNHKGAAQFSEEFAQRLNSVVNKP